MLLGRANIGISKEFWREEQGYAYSEGECIWTTVHPCEHHVATPLKSGKDFAHNIFLMSVVLRRE